MKTITTKQNIPQGWQEKSLGSFLVISKGKLPKKTYDVADENSVPYLSIKHLDGNEFKYAHKSDGVIAEKSDLLVVADGSGSGRMYRGYYGLVSSTFLKISTQFPNEISNDYLEVLFSHLDFTNPRFRKGGAIPHFDFKQLKDVDILLPPINEQQKIAEILGAVDADIAKTQEVIETTEKLKRGLMQQLFTRGIGHTKFKETKIGNIPDEWKLVQIKDAPIIISDGNYSAKYPRQDEFMKEGVPFVRVNNLRDQTLVKDDLKYISAEKHSELKKGHLKTNDVLITTRGQLGILALVPVEFDDANINAQIVLLRADNKTLLPKFLMHFLSSPEFQSQVFSGGSGSALQQLPIRVLENTYIPLPPANEQQEIAEIFSAVDDKISVNKKLKEKLTLLKKGLMQDLLSGRVRAIIK